MVIIIGKKNAIKEILAQGRGYPGYKGKVIPLVNRTAFAFHSFANLAHVTNSNKNNHNEEGFYTSEFAFVTTSKRAVSTEICFCAALL